MSKVSVVIPSRRDNVLTLDSVDRIGDYVTDMHIVKEGTTGEAMNRGAAQAKSRVILFLDDDVAFTRGFFLECLNELESTPNCLIGLRTSDGMSCMFTMIRTTDFFLLGGIKLPNYYLDTELRFRAETKGLKVMLKPLDSVHHLSPTPSGFWSRKQRLLWFHSAYVRIQYPDKYTENNGQWQNIRLRHFMFRRESSLLRTVYMDLMLMTGVLYYGYVQRLLGKIAYNCGTYIRLPVYIAIRISLRAFMGKERRNRFLKQHSFIEDKLLHPSHTFWYAVRWATHEKEVSRLARKIRGRLFVDVGADKGYFSLLLRRNFSRIIAFEPGDTYTILEKHVAEAEADNITPVKKAVSNFEGEAVMLIAKYWGGDTNEIFAGMYVVSDPDSVTFPGTIVSQGRVECCSLSSFLKNEPVIDLVKVDVEGGEWNVLRGAEPIMNRIRHWIIELHDINRIGELEEYLTRWGYAVDWLDKGDVTMHIHAWQPEGEC